MKGEETKDLKITGAGQAAGGLYENIRTDGAVKINGDLICTSLISNGSLKVNGSIQGEDCRINGSGIVRGSFSGIRLRVDGSAQVDRDLFMECLEVHGVLKVDGNASAEKTEVFGGIEIDGNAKFEAFKVHGGFKIEGMLYAGTIELMMNGACRAKEIRGQRVHVRNKLSTRNLLAYLAPFLAVRLTVDVIEGDDIELEGTTARIVRGNSVKIGPGCKIGRVEYKHHYEDNPKAVVATVERV